MNRMTGGQPRLKTSLEHSFNDLLRGLQDESLPDLDDMISDEVEDISLLTPTPSLNESVHVDTALSGQTFLLHIDIDEDGKKRIQDFNNHAELQTKDDVSDEEFLSKENGFTEHDTRIGYRFEPMDDVQSESSTEDEIMEDGNHNNSAFDGTEVAGTNHVDFPITKDADQLNLDHSRHKTSLRRCGSLANRRKPTRSGRRSSMTNAEAIFQDSTEPPSSKDSEDEESPSLPTSATPNKSYVGTGFALPGIQQKLFSKLKPPQANIADRKHEDSSSQVQVKLKHVVKVAPNPEDEKQNMSRTYDKPSLRNVVSSLKLDSRQEHTFDKPALRSVDKRLNESDATPNKAPIFTTSDPALSGFNMQVQDRTVVAEKTGVFEKPELRKVESLHIIDSKVSTETYFEKPALQHVCQVRTPTKMSDKTGNEKPVWLTDMKLNKVCDNSNDRMCESRETEKPSWLHSATKKKNKLAEFMRTKENQADENKSTDTNMSALSSELVFRSPRSFPLTENGENVRNTQTPDTSPRKRLDSTDEQNNVLESKNNYTPSWLKSKDNLKVQPTTIRFLGGSYTSDTPQWKLELADRNKAKKKDPQDNDMVTDNPNADSSIPPWHHELLQRKKRPIVHQASVVASSEPEWKKMADDRQARLTAIVQPASQNTAQ